MAMTDAAKYIEFESREDAYNQLLYRLENDDGSVMLGVYGTPGIGKTTLIEQVSKRAMELQLFDQVAFVNARQILNARALRLKIGKCLDVEFPDEEEYEAAALAEKWAYGANILLIFDDVENKIPNLEDVGIPFGDNKWGNAKIIEFDGTSWEGTDKPVKGCKIIIISETKDICYINKCKELFEIETLDDDEAFDMILKVAGISSTIDLLDNKESVRLVCHGLPLKIAVLGNTLRGKEDEKLWRDTFLRMIRHGKGPVDVSLDVLPKDAKLCLLVCSVYDGAGDSMIPVDFLFRTAMVLGLFEGLETLADARYKLDSMVAILKSSLLLVEGTYNHVKMHGIVRDVARKIAGNDPEYAFHFEPSEPEANGYKWPKDIYGDTNTRSTRFVKLLSLTFDTTDVFEFPEDVVFQNLHTLIINFKDHPNKIKDDFFNVFVNLRHLVLSSTPGLPSSLCNLEANLHTFSISNCKLDDISMITRMKNLEMLSFDRVDFSTPPINLKDMEELRILHFTNCHGVALLEDSISSLSKLEELIITDKFQILNEEGWYIHIYPELSKLTRLTNLHIYNYFYLTRTPFQDEKIWQKLRRYTISFGENFQNGELTSSSKSLKFCSRDLEADEMVSLVQRSQELVLLDVPSGLPHCFRIEDGKEFAEVTRLKLWGCLKAKYLGKLVQWRLNKVALHSFSRLRVLDVFNCPQLEYLFSTSIAKGLQQLQELKVACCQNLEEIVYDQSEEECQEIITFPRLTSIDFLNLNSFKSFRSRSIITAAAEAEADLSLFDEMVKFPALKNVKINRLDSVQSVFDEKVDFPSLKVLDITNLWATEIWKMDSEGDSFGQLEILKVKTCKLLENLIPSGMLERLKYLREPKVEDCRLLLPMSSEDEHEEPSNE